MTEFPWDIKKGSDNKSPNAVQSAPELPAFLTGRGGPGESIPSNANSIPNILASAFSGMPMEEIKIEMPSFENKPQGQPAPFAPPNFDNFNDLSGMFNKPPNNPGAAGELKPSFNPSFSPQLSSQLFPGFSPSGDIPFLQSLNTGAAEKSSDMPPLQGTPGTGQLPFRDAKVPPTGTSNTMSPPKAGKRSPPPLFKLQLPDEEVQDTKIPGLPDVGTAGSPVFPFSAGPTESKEERSHASFSFPGNLPGNPFSPFSDSLPDYVAPSPDPFKGFVTPTEDPLQSQAAGSNSPLHVQQQSPLPGASDFGADPFAGQMQPPVPPLQGQARPPVNPFIDQGQPSSSPFPGPAQQSSNPFAPPSGGDPFSGTPSSPFDPFTGGTQPSGNAFPGQVPFPPGPKPSRNPLLKMDVLLKNLDSATSAVKSLFKGVVMGKSLIERMEEIKDEPVPADIPDVQMPFAPHAAQANPFLDKEPPVAADAPCNVTSSTGYVNPFDMEGNDVGKVVEEPFTTPDHEGIRKVTPIAAPLMELREEDRIDLSPDEGPQECVPGPDDELKNIISVKKDDFEPLSLDRERSAKGCPGMSPLDVLSGDGHGQIEALSSEIRDMKEEMGNALRRFADIDGNVFGLSSDVEKLGSMVAGLKEGEQHLADTVNKLGSLDEKVVSLENGLISVLSENSGIRAELARIEEGISELVNSYTALLVQMHESSQEADARFSRLEGAIANLSPMEDRLRSVEKAHGESQSMSMELAKSISSLMDGLGTTSGDLRDFKEVSELNNTKIREDLSLLTEYVDSELKKVGARSYKGYGQSVHLSSITKNSSNMKLCMEWLEFLMGLVGRNNLSEILSYYEELGWLTEQVRSELMQYAEGIDFYMEKPDWKLTPDDHVKSIWFIESLAGLKVDKNRLSVIDRDVERVKKGTEIYGI
ncbi:MAG: FlaD/FlaE family flagellar protein [Methanolobus sp.]|uniref:FlaD/FlaE family flagellar protein n=1 Tax=Methanolobus sp. TaxID=1874737 RepID=UPI00272FE7D8|nr:FlaD/FlaE family flagellar protein [Methanolobus sp.]MDP2218164.1 FlaD/FlaE family flagellar protein [Methanolobus sp.]